MSEQQILGAMILDNSLVSLYPLENADFIDQANGSIYRAMADLVAEDAGAGVESIEKRIKETTGRDYLGQIASLANNAVSSPNVRGYVNTLRSEARLRRIRSLGQSLATIEDPKQADQYISSLLTVGQTQINHTSDLKTAVADAITLLEELEAGKSPGLPTGIRGLDDMIGGLQPADLIVIGARSQHGKTALMLQIANNQTVPVGVISGEQPNVQLGMRAIAQLGGVSLKSMRTGQLSEAQWKRVDHGLKEAVGRQVHTMDKGNPSISEIINQARQWHHHHGIKALFVDYLQLVSGGGGGEHRLQVGDVVYQLKGLAKELDIPIVALAQVGRAIDAYPEGDSYRGRMPFANHLADSAKIEDAADQIITLYRPEVYWPLDHLRGVTYLNLCKNRHGAVGITTTQWTGEFVRFGDYK